MARTPAEAALDLVLADTTRRQAEAADPAASVWVSANAGTGKTHVLTMRVLRLLLSGTSPERILCLTYTKAAAAEMSKRVFGDLAKWVTAPEPDLEASLTKLIGRKPDAAERIRARTLFARAIETPGGLKVQTIHAFAERLLQRFPLEAGVPPGFSILDDATAREIERDAIGTVLARASRAPESPLGRALSTAIAYAAEDHFDEVLGEALGYRDWLAYVHRLEQDGKTGFEALDLMLKAHFGVRPHATPATIDTELAGLMREGDLDHAMTALAGGGKSDLAAAARLKAVREAATVPAKARAIADAFLTVAGEPRASLMTKGLKADHPDVDALLMRTQDRVVALQNERRGASVAAATLALTRLADAVLGAYTEAKGRRAALDFDDLIVRTASLLNTRGSSEWVLFKLDGGLDHILVDESQDTSPDQWRVVAALAEEFFSGTGAREDRRTLFAVGDEKQSIYSFQGAAPKMFAAMGKHFEERARAAGTPWRRIPLDLSFRTVEPVLAAVDGVFANPGNTPGVAAGEGRIHHAASRIGRAGLVEIWPAESHDESAGSDAWAPLDEAPAVTPVVRLANRIADTIQGWLLDHERLVSEDRPVRPGDVLILVRKRNPFAGPMVAALKARKIPVAGADRIALTGQIAVQDLMALGDFLTLPEDDLALAAVLKSPLFGLDDAALFSFAHGRKGTLWKALLDQAASNAALRPAAETLKRWRRGADFSPPFEFFASLLDKDGMRARLLCRLGPDASDPIDEFLNLALTYDDSAPPSLAGFLTWLRSSDREVKRDMEHGRDEVRVMTVHGAKGLEAPIVFLPDTCSAASAGRQGGRPLRLEGFARPIGAPEAFAWPVKSASGLPAITQSRAAIDTANREELNRLLYVAMTRARDRLYVAGFEGKRGRDAGCWYELIETALAGSMTSVTRPDGLAVKRVECPQTSGPDKPKSELSSAESATALPAWAARAVPREPQLTVPLAPSRLAPYETDETGEPSPAPPRPDPLAEPPMTAPGAPADQNRFLRGTLTHALLEHLPSLDRARWQKAAKAFVAARGLGLSARTQASIVKETLAVLADTAFAPLFGPESRAEVPIVAEIPRRQGTGPALKLTGQIDRLAIVGDTVMIIDYKTNRPPPAAPDKVAAVYLFQLAAYALAVAAIFPQHAVRAAILWTDGPRIMEIPRDLLDSCAARLWDIDPASLDG